MATLVQNFACPDKIPTFAENAKAMNGNPVISFVMPAYKPQYLKQAIDSIVGQTFQDWELIVVDDCSPANLASIISPYLSDRRIRYYKNATNIGGQNLVSQWNHCIEFATGQWIVLAADDDIYDPEFSSSISKLASAYPIVDLIRSRVHFIADDDRRHWNDGQFPPLVDRRTFLNNWIDNKAFVCVGNFAFRRTKLLQAGGFIDFPCAFNSDIATPIVMSANGVANTRDMLFGFRLSDIHLSAQGTHPKEKLQAIALFYDWLSQLDYLDVSQEFLHKKYVFDCFNQVILFTPARHLTTMLKFCSNATLPEKMLLAARWLKNKLFL